MAIRKISRIQHRRGLKSDLPPKLHEGEFGWCMDTKELFIGNSDAEHGNSQVLTQWTPNDNLILHSYRGTTGFPADSTQRPIGSKLDDILSVKDFGAIGNGIADDTNAIQKAISDRYGRPPSANASPLSGFVTIFLPAGTYRITRSLALYPFVRLQGEGLNRTKIILDSADPDCVIYTADNAGNTTVNIGLNAAVLPQLIEVVDLWIDQPNPNADVVRIIRASNVSFKNCKLSGPRPHGSTSQTPTKAIVIETLGEIYIPENISIQNCEIKGLGYALYVNDPVRNLRINYSDIYDCWTGIALGIDPVQGGPTMIKVSNNHFAHIDSYGIGCFSTVPGVISSGNSFYNVGVVAGVLPIVFGAASEACASIGDQFDPEPVRPVDNQHPHFNIVIGPQYSGFSLSTPDLFGPLTLLDGNNLAPVWANIAWDFTVYNTILLDYSISRGTDKQVGKLTILTGGTINTTVLQDEFTTLGNDLGVSFGFEIDGTDIKLTYLTTSTGANATFKYTETLWYT